MVIAGQATACKEMIEDLSIPLDCIFAPVGGGGLLSGTSLSAHNYSPSTSVYGAEPEGAADAVFSFNSGIVQKAKFINTIADGLLTTLSERTLGIIRSHVKAIYLANDEEIKSAMHLVLERMKIIIEPSSAVALAVVIKNKAVLAGKNVGIIISGGNVDLARLPF
jgi:threonine dehydratase